ncbi:threonine synthase [Clostridium sp. chh4-2]|uniref:threonine synthase n=1 Tax=Clostridium sp. chh4-2 TaxID=2067550 RepID=UPI000CCDAFBF|nr:threonine synthase [Clostridium sp. chh4-2]PNV60801.1 threonine synthase [Clostridium sp. chh4-2]
MKYICSKCGKEESVTTLKPSCQCGGLWKLDFKASAFTPELIDRDTWGIFRYRAFMPLLDDSWKNITLGEGMTPVIRFSDDVLLKMDYFMPTLSFKDRGAAVLVSHCKSIGVDFVVQDSSGNAGNSVAAYCAKAGIGCEIFVPEGTSPKKIDMIKSHGAEVHVVPGSRDHCADVCRSKVKEEGKYYANHVYNPFFYEGTKTYIYEIFEQLHRIPEHLFIPLGNGTLFIGAIKALEEFLENGIIGRMPQIVAVQSEYCAPFMKAVELHSHKPEKVEVKPTMAEGIAIGVPMRGAEILEYIYKYKIRVITAPENRILEARAALAAKGIYCEHTTAASYAAYQKYCEVYGPARDALLSMCGAGLKSDH